MIPRTGQIWRRGSRYFILIKKIPDDKNKINLNDDAWEVHYLNDLTARRYMPMADPYCRYIQG